MKTKNAEKGFTLIELITVIVILALLAVFAIPRYLEALSAARKSTVLGVEAAVQAAVALVKARAKLEGDNEAGTVTLEKGEGDTVAVNTTSQLVPTGTEAGIGAAIDLRDTQSKVTALYTTPPGSRVATYYATDAPGAPAGACTILYTETTATGAITIATDVSGC